MTTHRFEKLDELAVDVALDFALLDDVEGVPLRARAPGRGQEGCKHVTERGAGAGATSFAGRGVSTWRRQGRRHVAGPGREGEEGV